MTHYYQISSIFSRDRFLLLALAVFVFQLPLQSQICDCTVEQVSANSVDACEKVIGNITVVSTATEFRNAISQANAAGGNSTILIEDGDYQVATTTSYPYITANNLVIRSLNGNRDNVILRGSGNIPGSTTENGMLIAGNNVTIADLTIREVGNHGIQVSGHDLYVHNVRIQDTYEQMIKGSTSSASIDDAIVQCSLFEYTQGIGPNWYIGGLDIHKGKGWLVRDNVFHDIASPSVAVAEHAIHFWDNSLDNTVERNLIYNCDRGIGFGLGNSGNQNSGGIIRNNMIYNDGSDPYHDVGIGLESSPNTRVYNNTVYISYFNAIEYRFTTTSNVEIINNLTNKSIASRNGGSGFLATNVTNAQSSWFVNTAAGDLHLATNNQSVVDQGTELPAYVTDDVDQLSRPLGSQTDIGAQEYLISGIHVTEDCITVYSNTSNNFTISGTLDQYTIEILNISGNILQVIPSTGSTTMIDLSALPTSYYFLRITNVANGLVSLQTILVF